jgi:hypothetical protein
MKKSLLLILSLLLISSFAISCDDDDDSNNATPYCGDGECNNGETNTTCATDCPVDPWCGDGTCNGTETLTSCATDCVVATCGDGTCNGDETTTTCATDCKPSIAIEDFENAASAMMCENYLKCNSDPAYLMMDDATECLENFDPNTKAYIELLVSSINGGTIIYDPEAAYACIEEMNAMNCTEISNITTTQNCLDTYIATVDASGGCAIDEECINGFCNECFCKTYIADGLDCKGYYNGCAPNSYCANDTCTPFVDWLQEDDYCGSGKSQLCDDGLYCDDNSSSCEILKTEDATCGENMECAYPMNCVENSDGTEVCTVITILETTSLSCDYNSELCDGFDGLACDYNYVNETGTCVTAPILNEVCRTEDSTGDVLSKADCDFTAGLYCAEHIMDATEYKCMAKKLNNIACENDYECLSSSCDNYLDTCKDVSVNQCY